jgi:LmbE family N-acetylglucosaminyl deacetylase
MQPLKFNNLRSILCLGAHSDDIEIGCGGTIAKLLAEHKNIAVHWVVFSASEERASEARSSAEAFLKSAGKHTIALYEFRDTCFPFVGLEIKERFIELQREVQPDLIFTHRRDDAHQDHRLIGELTWNAFRNHFILEYEIPKYEGDLGSPNFFVPLDAAAVGKKCENLLARFSSQREKPWFTADTFKAVMRLRGIECNSPGGFAEGFYCRKTVLG